MAIKFNATEETTRQDTFKVSPIDIIRGHNSRIIVSANYDEQVKDLAFSIAVNGQSTPAEARRATDEGVIGKDAVPYKKGDLILTAGFTRLDAITLLRSGFEYTDAEGNTRFHHEADAQLWIKVYDCTEEDAFYRGLRENLERNDTSDLQDALAQNDLRTGYGWSDVQIARFYGKNNQNRVMALEKLLHCTKKVQALVHEKKLSLSAAVLGGDHGLSPEEVENVIDGAATGRGKVDGAALKALIREALGRKEAAAEAAKEEATLIIPVIDETTKTDSDAVAPGTTSDETTKIKKIKRSVKEFQNFTAEINEREGVDQRVKDLFAAFGNWFDGKKGFGNTGILNRIFKLQEDLKPIEIEDDFGFKDESAGKEE